VSFYAEGQADMIVPRWKCWYFWTWVAWLPGGLESLVVST
jgi:hypothetical protein